MKKIRFVFAAAALALAGAGVFANSLVVDQYYRAQLPGGADIAECFFAIPPEVCVGNSVQCKRTHTVSGEQGLYRISKRLISEGQPVDPCQQVKEAN